MTKQQFNIRLEESDIELVEKIRRRRQLNQAETISWAIRRLARAEGFLGAPDPKDDPESAAYFLNKASEAFGELSDLAELARGFVESAQDRIDPLPEGDDESSHYP